ncbi:MAG TPA: DUF4232 domain-containing protein [Acidimicrobiales bacterium]
MKRTVAVSAVVLVLALPACRASDDREAAPCAARTLAASVSDVAPGAAGGAGRESVVVELENTGSTTCAIQGFVDVLFVDASGGALPTQSRPATAGEPRAVEIGGGQAARFTLRWLGAGPECAEVREVAGAQVRLPQARGTVALDLSSLSVKACGGDVEVSALQ